MMGVIRGDPNSVLELGVQVPDPASARWKKLSRSLLERRHECLDLLEDFAGIADDQIMWA